MMFLQIKTGKHRTPGKDCVSPSGMEGKWLTLLEDELRGIDNPKAVAPLPDPKVLGRRSAAGRLDRPPDSVKTVALLPNCRLV